MLLNNIYKLRLLFRQISDFFLPALLDDVSVDSSVTVLVVIEIILAIETMIRKIKRFILYSNYIYIYL
jgi:hypothetical protein